MDMSHSNGVLLQLPIFDCLAYVELLERGGFFVAPYDDQPWGGGEITWQGFHIGWEKAIASTSISIWNDAREPSHAHVTTYKHVLGHFCWPRDRRLVRNVVAWLQENGATKVPDRPATQS